MAVTKPNSAKTQTSTQKTSSATTRTKTPPPAQNTAANSAKTSGTMGDKEIYTDMLSGQKFLTSAYNNYAGECQSEALRNDMLNILKEEHTIQNELFTEMNTRGWYKTKAAPAREVTTALNKYQ